ncbi:MAG: flagellar filament capping protein FliD, partial [Tepidisphaeraceae bacterium]
MGTITSGTGLISGINTTDVINQLMAIDGQQTTIVQSHIDDANAQKTAYTDLQTRLTGIQITAQQLAKPSFFANAAANSSDESVLTATAAAGTPVGSYQFQVARLVQAEQLVSGGFSDYNKTPVGAGTLTLERGGGTLDAVNNLNDLRGGQGISRGQIRVTDRTGKSALIDLGDAVTLDDVVKKINTSVDINVKATVANNKLTLTDASGGTAGNLIVQDVGDTTAAADLGITGSSATGTVTGSNLQYVGRDTTLASLNDGNGVSDVSGADFQLHLKNGSILNVDLNGAATVGQAIDAINQAANGKATAALNADGSGITLTDTSGGGGTLSVTPVGTSSAAADLGLTAAASGNTLTGSPIQAPLGTVLLKTLNGGQGLTLGTIHIADRSGTAKDVDLSQAKSVQDVLDAINTAGVGVTAALNNSGNGISLTDTSGGTGNLVISDASGTGAAQLGIAGTFDNSKTTVQGANLQRKWVSPNMSLAKYNGGKGVSSGDFTITAANGQSSTITVDTSTDLTLGDVMDKINKAFNGKVVASINAHGDGIALTDNTAGAGKLTVADTNGTAAANLNLVGTATGNVLDGSEEKTIDITATDTLQDVQTKINNLGWGVQASIINDGSGAAAYRLSLNATGSGVAGQVTFDSGTTNLATRTLVKAQDAAVFVGSANSDAPLLVTSSSNSITGVIKGLTLNLTSVSKDPVTVSVTNDVSNVTDALTKFVQSYNDLVDKIGAYTQFGTANTVTNADGSTTVTNADGSTTTTKSDGTVVTVNADGTTTNTDPNAGATKTVTSTAADGTVTTYKEGVLLGDYSVSQIQDQLNAMIQTVVPQAGKYKILASVGLTVGDGGHLQFDADKFNTAYADDPNSVKALFTTTSASINPNTQLRFINDGKGVTTAGDGVNDFKATLKDGSSLNVSIGKATTISDIISSINAAGKGKLTASLTDNYQLQISDLTTGAGSTVLTQLNGSQFLAGLGLTAPATDGSITGQQLSSIDPVASASGGIGVHLQQSLNSLINTVDGLITTESNTLDDRISQSQSRISDLNAIRA